jgi:4-oxalocrotonate tautomerase
MPHVIVKLWPGKSDAQKKKLAEHVTKAVTSTLHYGAESVSVGIEEVDPRDWTGKVSRHPRQSGNALQKARLWRLAPRLAPFLARPVAQRVNQESEGRRGLAPARVEQVVPRIGRTPIGENAL